MGWDGYANRSRGNIRKFKKAAEAVKSAAGAVDGMLERGALDCSACAMALEAATGASCWDDDGWDAKKVRRLAASATWPSELATKDAWAVLSAKAFLETCAEIGTGIHFSW